MSKFINPDLLKQIEKHEGRRNTIYYDSKGVPTIGIGCNLNEPLHDDVIEFMFVYKMQEVIREIKNKQSWILEPRAMNQVRRNVFVELVYNLGITKFGKFYKMIAGAKAKDWQTAHDNVLWNFHKDGTKTKTPYWIDVKGRAKTLAKQILSG